MRLSHSVTKMKSARGECQAILLLLPARLVVALITDKVSIATT
jgi:hypothetical protein